MTTNEEHICPDVEAVFGPFPKKRANWIAEKFNKTSTVCRVPDDGGPNVYRPVKNAPGFIEQDRWDEHFAQIRPMNDME